MPGVAGYLAINSATLPPSLKVRKVGTAEPCLAAHGPPLHLSRQHIRLNGYRELDSVCTRRTGVTVYVRGV
ncbi:hypothetical protein CF041_24995 [Klebsiella pneumoniae]|nr:hypothetical protein [Klebsiella pneumoniae]